jgi:methylmalonyl-CoA mutase, N-terminal domain
VEALTHRIEAEAYRYIARIDEFGGMVAAIEQGYPQREIQNTAYQYQLEIERKERIVVGLNGFTQDSAAVPVMKVDPRIEAEQVARLRAHRAKRDASKFATAIEAIAVAAKGTENLLPRIFEAVKVGATVGEVSNALRQVWGEHVETLVL